MTQPLVTVVGSANVDFIMRVPRLPAVGETVTDGEFRQVFGGKGANSAVAAARASGGSGRVAFVGRLGDDPFAPRMLSDFRNAGLDVEHVSLDANQPTGAALVMFDANGDNYLTVAPGSNYALAPAHVDAAAEVIGKSRVVLMQMEIEPPASPRRPPRCACRASVPNRASRRATASTGCSQIPSRCRGIEVRFHHVRIRWFARFSGRVRRPLKRANQVTPHMKHGIFSERARFRSRGATTFLQCPGRTLQECSGTRRTF